MLFRSAVTTGAPRPVHLRLQGSHGQGLAGMIDAPLIIEEHYRQVPAHRPEPEIAQVKRALAVLGKAQRPVIVAGGGVTASGAQAELVQLAEKLNIPVVTSLNGKGAILDTHPLSVGVVGSYSRESANRVVGRADLQAAEPVSGQVSRRVVAVAAGRISGHQRVVVEPAIKVWVSCRSPSIESVGRRFGNRQTGANRFQNARQPISQGRVDVFQTVAYPTMHHLMQITNPSRVTVNSALLSGRPRSVVVQLRDCARFQ